MRLSWITLLLLGLNLSGPLSHQTHLRSLFLTNINSRPAENPGQVSSTGLRSDPLRDYLIQKSKISSDGGQVSLSQALNPDGTLKDGVVGTFNARGFNMKYGRDGEPVFSTSALAAGDERWQSIPNFTGLGGIVYTVVTNGSDVYVGGSFLNAGGNPSADRIARWSNGTWHALGTGIDNGEIYAIGVSGTTVYVGGSFINANGNANADRIARWNGTNWLALGSGINIGTVNAIAVSGSNVYIGGSFNSASFVLFTSRIALWNGSAWSALGSGVNGTVDAIAVSGSNVYVGGSFTEASGNTSASRIAVWNGTSWGALGSGLNNTVYAIAISGTLVFAGGSFTDAGGNTNADRVAMWNGTAWSALGTGVNDIVRSLTVTGGSTLYVGGTFTDAGGNINADRIATWNGTSWNSLGTGIDNAYVYTIALSAGFDLYVGGSFADADGNADRAAVWDGTSWMALANGITSTGASVSVSAVFINGQSVYIGGNFDDVAGNPSADNVAMWNGSSWNALGTGLNNTVRTLAMSGSDLYVGGSFTDAGGNIHADKIAFWNGTSWNNLGTSSLVNTVECIVVNGSSVYMGGSFFDAGGNTNADYIAIWNGSSWNALGAGLKSSVSAIAIDGDLVYAGGGFTDVGGNPDLDRIAVWNGSSWQPLGAGLNSDVRTIAIKDSQVYVGGFFTDAGGNPNADRIAMWDGTAWNSLGTGIANGSVASIVFSGSTAFVGGAFVDAGGVANADNIAVWNGTTWNGLGSGLNASVGDVVAINGSLYLTGSFTATGDKNYAAYRIIQRNGIFPGASLSAAEVVDPFNIKFNGVVNAGGLNGSYRFEWGTTKGAPVSFTTPQSISGSADIPVSTVVASSTANTTLYYRIRVENEEGISFSDERSYTFPPDIEVRLGSVVYSSSNEYNFGNVSLQASSSDISFSILNLGLGNLTLNSITKIGSNVSDFTVTQTNVVSPVVYSNNVSFSVKFTPVVVGVRTVSLSISSNDPDEPNYLINLKGTATKLFQTITFLPLPAKTFGDPPFTLSATGGGSGNAITFSSSNPLVATVLGNEVTIIGAGTANISASQEESATYYAADDVTQALVVNKRGQTITFDPLPDKSVGDAPFSLAATASSGLAATYTSSNLSVANIVGGEVTILGPGTTVITAAQAGDGNYNAAADVMQTMTVLNSEPAAQPTSLIFSEPTPTSVTVSFTEADGNPDGYVVFRREGNPSTDAPVDGDEYVVNTTHGQSTVVYVGSDNSFTDVALSAGTAYYYAVYSFNGTNGTYNYLTDSALLGSRSSLVAEPGSQATNIGFSDVTPNSIAVAWTNSTGAERLLLGRQGSPIAAHPGDGLSYSGNADFASANDLGEGHKVLYRGSGSSVNVTGLAPATVYYFHVYELNGTGDQANYLTASNTGNPASKSTLASEPVDQPSDIAFTNVTQASLTISFAAAPGSPTGYIALRRSGSPSTNPPIDGTEYSIGQTVVSSTVAYAGAALTFTDGGLSPGTDYHYAIYSYNGTTNTYNYLTASPLPGHQQTARPAEFEISPPVFESKFSNSAKISVDVTGANGPVAVTMHARKIADADLTPYSVALKPGSPTTYEIAVSDQMADELGMEFYFTASDGVATVENPVHYFIYKSINTSDDQRIPFAPGFNGKTNTYQMFSIPYELATKDIDKLFDVALDGHDSRRWRLFHYQSNSYREYPNQFKEINVGNGYWFNIISTDFQIILGDATVTKANQTDPFIKTLEAGWNQIGNPYPFDISWEAVIGTNEKVGSLWSFNNGTYSKSDVLKPWGGAFVHADEPVTLPIPVTAKKNFSGRASVEFSADLDSEQWLFPITLRIGHLQQAIGVGMHPKASISKDKFDEISVPHFLDFAEMSTYHTEFFSPHFSTDVLPTGEDLVWTFDVKSNLEEEQAELNWDHTSVATSESSLILIDVLAGNWIDMKKTGSYLFTHKAGRQFKIVYNRGGDVKPGMTLAGVAYPNPFTSEVHIPLLVGEPGYQQIEIYDGLGRMIKKIGAAFDATGIAELIWNTADDNETQVSSGVLWYRLSGSRRYQVKRLIKR